MACPKSPYKINEITENIENIMKCQQRIIESVFGNDFNITFSLKDRTFKIKNRNESDDNKYCAVIGIYNNELYIMQIYNCIILTGNQIIQNIINIAAILEINNINLEDGAIIKCINNSYQFNIYLLTILQTGRSWYNKMGFISDNYQNELLQNKYFISMKVKDFIEQGLLNKSIETKPQYIQILNNKPEWFDKNVQELTNYFIKNKLRSSITINCNDDEIIWFIYFLEIAKNIIQYDSYLFYNPQKRNEIEINNGFNFSGGKKNKKNKKMNKINKHKQTKTKRTNVNKYKQRRTNKKQTKTNK